MTGCLLSIIMIVLCSHMDISSSQFNLYHTESEGNIMLDVYGYDCLYLDLSKIFWASYGNSLTPYCIRPASIQSKSEERVCYGQLLTFKQLKESNTTTDDLFTWNAVIDIIDLYAKYLLTPNLLSDNKIYCKCSSLSIFGKYCQYTLKHLNFSASDERSFTKLVENVPRNPQPPTCYIGIQCQTHSFCLDWRQICNGIIDCEHGEDEPFDLCLQIETNQCNNQTEFRCKNGLCIPMSLGYDITIDCPDRSDVTVYFVEDFQDYIADECSWYPGNECDELNFGWKEFSCGNNQFISYADLMSPTGEVCKNHYDLIYLRKIFDSNDQQDQCWKSMVCVTNFSYLYSNINCSNKMMEIRNIDKSCPDEYYFPFNSIVYSFVYFLYEKNIDRNWLEYTGPNYICYKKESCQSNHLLVPVMIKNNLTCIYMDEKLFSWKNVVEYITYLFHPCFYSINQTSLLMNNTLLYQCHLSDTYVSTYRVRDGKQDCFYNEDESSDINLCSLDINDDFECLINADECIQRLLVMNGEYDCLDRSDEYFSIGYDTYHESTYKYRIQNKIDFNQIYHFKELCNHIPHSSMLYRTANETDESDCEHWLLTCNSIFTNCDNLWNCKNGADEISCSTGTFTRSVKEVFECKQDEHYCIRFINNNTDINTTCIHMNRTNDGVVDCIGGTDERLSGICTDSSRRFSCMNSSRCIKVDEICDGIIHCPYEDDERVCPWLFHRNTSDFYCQKSSPQPIKRCDDSLTNYDYCQWKEELWFCDLEVEDARIAHVPDYFELYPSTTSLMTIDSNEIILSKTPTLSLITVTNDTWLCNRGYPIESNNQTYCLCSPAFYGDYCQYQSERLSILFQIQILHSINPHTIFHLMIYLFDEKNVILSYDEIIYNQKITRDKYVPFFSYLTDQRIKNMSLYKRMKSKSVRIDSYIIKENHIQYISSSIYHVSFSFLPVNRLTLLLPIEDESFEISICQKKCSSHGKCMYYLNNQSLEYCWCDQDWYGDECQLQFASNLCHQTSCSSSSQCLMINEEKQQIKCLCPLGKSGKECYIHKDTCRNIICQNNGTCFPLDERIDNFICICQDGYEGISCQKRQKISNVFIPANITMLTEIPAVLIISASRRSNILIEDHRFLYSNVRLPITLKIPGLVTYWFVRMYYNSSKSSYYLAALKERDTRPVNTSVLSANLCHNVSDLLNRTVLDEYSYLKRLKLYHLPCNANQELRCFFDEYRMCLCTRDHHSDCFVFVHEYGNCNYCTHNHSVCLQRKPDQGEWEYICLCPSCTYGRHCEFSTGNYYITFDMLIGIDMVKDDRSFNQQSFMIYLTLIILSLIVIFSLIFNTISWMIFRNEKLRQVGCDLYLFYLTIISQLGLLLLYLRFIFMIITQIYIIKNVLFVQISCKILEYVIRLIPSIFDWLTVCISIERAYTVLKDIQFTKVVAMKTLKLSRWIIMIVIGLNILTTMHRPFYLVLIDEPTLAGGNKGHPMCILNFDSNVWNIYEKTINIVHLTLPLVLNIISLIYFLLYKTKLESTTTVRVNQNSRFVTFMNQLQKYKPLAIGTLIIIMLEIPRFISTFVLSCIEYRWQRYVYLIGYLISYLPLAGILFIYVLRSPKYKEEYIKIMKKRFPWLSFKQQKKEMKQ